MNKCLFSLACVTALATVASAEVVQKNNYLPSEAYSIVKDITSDVVRINQSVSGDTALDKDKHLKETDETAEKQTTLVIKNDGLVKFKGSGKLTFKRDGDLVLKNNGVLNVQNKSSEFSFENVRMDNGVLKLTNSNFKVSDKFKTENNSQITLKADTANKANIKAKNINLNTLNKLEVDNYTLQSSEDFTMSNIVDATINNSSFNSGKNMTIKNLTSTVNFTGSSLQAKNKILLKNNKGNFNQTDIKSTDGDIEISGEINFNGKETDKSKIIATNGSVKLKDVNSGIIKNASISGENINLDKFNTEIKKSSLKANKKIDIKNSKIISNSTKFDALPQGIFLENLQDGSEFIESSFSGNEVEIKNSNVSIKKSKLGEKKTPSNKITIDGGKISLLESELNGHNINISNLNDGDIDNTKITVKTQMSLKDVKANINNSDIKVGDENSGELTLDNSKIGKKTTINSKDIVVKNDVTFNIEDEYSSSDNNRVKITTTNIKKEDGATANLTLQNVDIMANQGAKLFYNFTNDDKVNLKGENVVVNESEATLGSGLRFTNGGIFRKDGAGTLKASAGTINSISHLKITDGTLKVNGELKFENGRILSMDYKKGLLESESKISINQETSSQKNKAKFNILGSIGEMNERGETNPFIKTTQKIEGNFELMNNNNEFFKYRLINDGEKIYAKVFKNSKVFQNRLNELGYTALLGMGKTLDAATDQDQNGNVGSKKVLNALASTLGGKPVEREDLIYLQPLLSGQGTKIVSDMSNSNKNLILNKENKKDKNFWGIISTNFDKKDFRNDGVLGYKGDHYSVITGIDGFMGDNANVGLAFAFTKSNVKGDLDHKLDINSYETFLYSDIYPTDKIKFDLIAGAGISKNKGQRSIRFANNLLKSKYDSKFYTFGLGASYTAFENNDMKFMPYFKADYFNVTNDAYKETGDNKIALSVDKSKFNSLMLEAGLKSDFVLKSNLNLNTKIGVAKEVLDKQTSVDAEFLGFMGQKDSKFNIKSKTDSEVLGVVGIGLSYDVTELFNIDFGYNAKFSKEYKNHNLLLGFEYKF